ncbi:quinone oxidoreductase family protein [Streptomyces profundus]|uniref:quinone oxidoreductase family protein n=1 Tax=Streptomyces profundus TaxID=2867410 RepID=UPI001D165D45|nr:zinc-binding dehydrogenase [Streptomyces sp. MA3_2.13]UED87755.1 zinc-binding dehydrogenase [Streptomyces sp. MA3_2.13]
MRAVVMEKFGGPEVLRLAEVPDLEPRVAHEVLRVTRAGVNWADVHTRTDSYLAPMTLPCVPGNEVVGRAPDGRRLLALTRGGGYAEQAHAHRRVSWEIPDDISDDQALPLALQGQAAWHLLFTVARLQPGESVLIPAAAGGVGSMAVQLARAAGARVVALASTEEKRQLALDLGAEAAVDSTADDLAERVVEVAGGPVRVALEMTGGRVLRQTLGALAPRGRVAVYGYVGGQLADLPTRLLMEKSITVSGFWLPHLYGDRAALSAGVEALFHAVRTGALRPVTGGLYPLAEAAAAHSALATRTHLGKLALSTAA